MHLHFLEPEAGLSDATHKKNYGNRYGRPLSIKRYSKLITKRWKRQYYIVIAQTDVEKNTKESMLLLW